MGGPLSFVIGLMLLGGSAVGKIATAQAPYRNPLENDPEYIPLAFTQHFSVCEQEIIPMYVGRSKPWKSNYCGVFDIGKLRRYMNSTRVRSDLEENGNLIHYTMSREYRMICEYVAEYYLTKLGFKKGFDGYGLQFARLAGLPCPDEIEGYDETVMINSKELFPYLREPRIFDPYRYKDYEADKRFLKQSWKDQTDQKIYYGLAYPFSKLRDIETSSYNRDCGCSTGRQLFFLDNHTDKMPEIRKPYFDAERRVFTEKGIQQMIDLLGLREYL